MMELLKIARLGHPAIRGGAAPLSAEELAAPATQQLIDAMIATMRDADGVGIAAPQVHVPRRLIVIEVAASNPRYPDEPAVPLMVVANPEISWASAQTEDGWEGCLSVPDLRGRVPRHAALEVRGLDRQGRPLQIRAQGFLARIVQHEIDHLDGKVYLDRMPDLATLSFLREWQRHWL